MSKSKGKSIIRKAKLCLKSCKSLFLMVQGWLGNVVFLSENSAVPNMHRILMVRKQRWVVIGGVVQHSNQKACHGCWQAVGDCSGSDLILTAILCICTLETLLGLDIVLFLTVQPERAGHYPFAKVVASWNPIFAETWGTCSNKCPFI